MDDYKKFAPTALVIAGIALIASFVIYVLQKEWNTTIQISLGVVVVALALSIFLDPDRSRRFFSSRQAKYGSNALILTIAFIGILVVVNYVVYQNAQEWGLRWDLTEGKTETLAPESIAALAALPEPVFVKAFYTAQQAGASRAGQNLLDDYKSFSGGNFDYVMLDPNSDVGEARTEGIARSGTFVFQMGENKIQVDSVSEIEFTTALVQLMNSGSTKIYFLLGHGERSIDEAADFAYTRARQNLENRNYSVEPLNLLAENEIPGDASAIVIAGPLQPLTPGEVSLLAAYLNDGGSLIVMEDPTFTTQFGTEADPMNEYLAANWGIEYRDDMIVDATSQTSPFYAVTAFGIEHPIMEGMTGFVPVFPLARSIVVAEQMPEGVLATPVLLTADQSWGETNAASLETGEGLEPNPEEDAISRLTLVAVAENSFTGARVVVIGDADFAADAIIDQFGNDLLFSNMVDWVAQQENLINLTVSPQTQRIVVPPTIATVGVVFLITVIGLPGGALLGALIVFIRRRRRA